MDNIPSRESKNTSRCFMSVTEGSVKRQEHEPAGLKRLYLGYLLLPRVTLITLIVTTVTFSSVTQYSHK